MTIKKQEDERWIYVGLCYSGETTPAVHHIFVYETFRNPDFGMTMYKSIHRPVEYMKHQDHWYSAILGRIDGKIQSGIMVHIVDKNGRELSSEKTIPWDE